MQFVYADGWSDYYDTLPGGEPRGRSLLAKLFDIRELGEWAPKLSRYKGPSIPANSNEFPELFLLKRTWGGKRKAMQLAGRMLYQKITGKELVSNGAALQGRMLQMALRADIPIWTDTPVREFIVEDGRVTGVVAIRNGREMRVCAREGVLLNAGGFSHNAEMRRKYQPQPSSSNWTNANPGDTGEVLEAAVASRRSRRLHGRGVVGRDFARSRTRRCPRVRARRTARRFPSCTTSICRCRFRSWSTRTASAFATKPAPTWRSGNACIGVRRRRVKPFPRWVVMDSRQRKYYPWGSAMQGQIPQQWLDSGYMIKARSIEELAAKCGIDAAGLQATVTRFNGFCETGVDSDYGRGSRAFDRCHGDPTIKPNPNLGPIEQAPFYAVRMYPGDVGTAGGLVTDEYARVLKEDGSLIPGLYATGNCTASVVGRCYPGAGSSIGASFVFGYIAALHASGAQTIW